MPLAMTLVALNVVLFGLLAAYALILAEKTPSWSVRWLWRLVALPAAAVVVGGLHRLLVQAVSLGWLPKERLEFALGEWLVVKSLVVVVIGIVTFAKMRRLTARFSSLEVVVGDILDRVQTVDLDALELTAREREVLDVVGAGDRFDDRTLAEKLSIAPNTAHAHIRALLRKTKLRDRRDLAVVAFLLNNRDQDSSTLPR